jgi:phosphomannomutase
MSAMLAEYFLKQNPGASIVYDARNSKSVPEIITENGGTPVRERVGHAFLKQTMRKTDAPFGGEASGHFYFRDNWYADSGLIGAIIGLYAASLSGKKLSELRQQYTRYAAIPETNFTVEDKDAVIQNVTSAFADGEQDTLDGLTINFADGSWFNIRASNTEPLLRLNAEAKDQATLDALVSKVKTAMGQ